MLQDGGDGKAALENYRRALAIREKLAAGHPERPDWQRDVSVSWNKIGNVLKDGGDGKAALENYRRALAIAEKLRQRAVGRHPSWRGESPRSPESVRDRIAHL